MEVFLHHIYEYKKGLRRMVLHTASASDREKIVRKLVSLNISHIISDVSDNKINVFFGEPACIKVVRSFGDLDLTRLTDEQDFILGALLGYDILGQCKRYIKRRNLLCSTPLPVEHIYAN